ncbi:hypothetical protein AOQ84DRAFT_421918 [Glonium stellatum]|uniref:Uncharacterized protein n=1 Tax=Glonium stellatum TaxID=574774 RepID=A0A8E2F8L3_9PEZI|nr:hypothetical protein AOQ84DRAFT_421918 [Glonium stellatum]
MSNNAYNHAYYAAYSAANGQQYYYPVIPPPPYGAPPSGPPTGPLIDIPGQVEQHPPPPAPMPPSQPRPSARAVSMTQGYVSLPRTYPQETNPTYRVGYQYENSYRPNHLQVVARSARHPSSERRASPAQSRSSSVASHLESRTILRSRTTEEFTGYPAYQHQDPYLQYPPPQLYPAPAPLCHTCTICGKPRSRAFHHHYPVIPGKDTIKGVCAKCRKKGRDRDDKGAEVVHRTTVIRRRRRCKPEPVDRSLHIRITSVGSDEGRGRSSSEEIITRRVRSLSRDHCPRPLSRTRITIRSSSESPPREVTHKRIIRRVKRNESPSLREEILSPVPRARSLSPMEDPPRFYGRLEAGRGRADAERRIASHPMPFRHGRTVLPDQRAFINHRSSSSSPRPASRHSTPPGRSQSRPRGILRSPSRTRYPSPDTSVIPPTRRSIESMAVEVGGPRVQFVVDPVTSKRHSVTETSTEFWKSRSRDRHHRGGDGHHSGTDSGADPPPCKPSAPNPSVSELSPLDFPHP